LNRGNRLSIECTIELYERIDATCDAFEQAWLAGQHPDLEPFLLDYPPDERSRVFHELFAVELEYCRNAAQAVDRETWFQRFPEFQTIIDDGFGRPEETGILAGASTSDVIPLLLPPADDLAHGQSLGRLKLLERIGEGGFGIVWRASDPDLDRQVAIKLPRQSQLSSTELNRLLEEARSVARLRHPNIATVYEVANHAGVPYIVSEFIEGDSLKVARSRWRASRDAARLCAKVARALHHAHERGVMHLDVKPANILLDTSGEPHLVDFGLARRLSVTDPSTSSPAPGSIAGTPAYMAPEQVAAGKLPVDARTDVYALGVVLYELLTEKRPFGGSTPQVLRQIVEDAPVPLRQRDPKIPRELEAICLKALQKDPAARYATASDFADDLERFLRGESIAARPAKLLQSCRWVRRHWVASLLTVSCLLLGGVAAWSIFTRPEEPDRGVLLTTRPEGAEVHFIPLDKRTGTPEPEKIVHAGRSPVNVDLLPGDYLVEVVWDDGRFHEVYRRVPEKAETTRWLHRHLRWTRVNPECIKLCEVEAPPVNAGSGMALLSGTETFQTAIDDVRSSGTPDTYRIPPFLMEPAEFTLREYKKLEDGRLVCEAEGLFELSLDDALPLRYRNALDVAEYVGMRLPDAMELQYAMSLVSAPSTRPVNVSEKSLQFGPVGSIRNDRINGGTFVFGLHSNVGEWTTTWGSIDAPGLLADISSSGLSASAELRIILGCATPVPIDRIKHPITSFTGNVTARWYIDRAIGVRMVRSLHPRLHSKDFSSPVNHR